MLVKYYSDNATKMAVSISALLNKTEQLLSSTSITSPRLDAEILLSHTLGVERTWLHAHGETELEAGMVANIQELVNRRLNREPIAYIIGKKEFYGRSFVVTPKVLIPRPETEDLIDLSLSCLKKESDEKIVDVGSGSGCIGITLKLERPSIDMTITDISSQALAIAKKNAEQLGAKVSLAQSDLLTAFPAIQNPNSSTYFDLIVANLPYVDKGWKVSPETAFEPQQALYAEDGGLALIKTLMRQSQELLKPGGFLTLEADPEQHSSIIEYAEEYGFKHLKTIGYAVALAKTS